MDCAVSCPARLNAGANAAARDSLQLAVTLLDQLGRPTGPVLNCLNLFFIDLHQAAARRRYFTRQLAVYQQRGNLEGLATCYHLLAGCDAAQGDYNRSLSNLLRAAELGRRCSRSLYYNELGVVATRYSEWGNYARAQHYFQLALQQPDASWRNFLYCHLTSLHLRQHQLPQALAAANEALRLAADPSDEFGRYDRTYALMLKSQVLLALGQGPAAGRLLGLAQQANDSLHIRLVNTHSPFELDAAWAQYYAAGGEQARAETAWQRAYQQARQGQSRPLQLAYLRQLARFYAQQHRPTSAAQAALTALQLVDSLTLVHYLRGKATLERAGGMGYVAGLTMLLSSAAHVEAHCRILLEYHARRTIITAGTLLQTHGYDEGRDALEVLTEAQLHLTGLHAVLDQRPAQTVADHLEAVFQKLAADVLTPGLTGVPTGLTRLNDATGGWQPGDLIILAARPAMGKTALMLHAARAAGLEHDKYVAIFSLEMPAAQLVQRLVASEVAGYSNSDLRRGNVPGGLPEVASIRQKASRLQSLGHRLRIDDTPGLSIQQLRAKCARLHGEHPLGLVLVDYIQLLRGEAKSRGNREQEISSISRGLKELAKELGVPVIALSQLSRDVEKRGGQKRPQLADLRESGAIEQDADIILFLWRGEYYKIDEYEDGSPTAGTLLLDIAKNRNGSVGEIIVGCNLKRGLVYDLGTDPGTSAELAAGEDYQPQGLRLSAAHATRPRSPELAQDDTDLPF